MPLSRKRNAIESEVSAQTAVMCVCFQRRRVCHNANYIPDSRASARKERNLHRDVHVTLLAQNSLNGKFR